MEDIKMKNGDRLAEGEKHNHDWIIVKVISNILGINKSHANKIIINVIENKSFRELLYINKYRDKLDIDTINIIKRKQDEIKNFIELSEITHSFGLDYLDLLKIFNVSRNYAKYHILDNPFLFTEEIGYDKAKAIADKLSLPTNTIENASALIIHLLKTDTEKGHTYSDLKILFEKLEEYKIDKTILKKAFDTLLLNKIYIKDNKIMFRSLFKIEENTSNLIKNKLKINSNTYKKNELNEFVEEFNNNNRFNLSDEQKEAIRVFAKSSLFILTGGPGTGKTQTAKAIVEYCKFKNLSISLSAATGKASQRLQSLTCKESHTIHGILGLTYVYKDAKNIVDSDVILVDEVSMVGTYLFYKLLKSVSDKTKIVIIGDVDQLPSVEAGNILESLIESNVIPTVKLKKVFRQAEDSKIIKNAHKIKNSDISLEYGNDFLMYKTTNDQETLDQILDIYEELLNKGYKPEDIAVLSPSKRTSIGTEELNFQIQRRFNKDKDYVLLLNGTKYELEDKVMQIRNNYEDWIYNGTLGYICSIKKDSIEVYFENGYVSEYTLAQIDKNIIHAYSSTIHKYQGSEVKVVIVPLSLEDKRMWNKKLFYTALTRAKVLFIMVGQEDVFKKYCMKKAVKRNTMLKELILSN